MIGFATNSRLYLYCMNESNCVNIKALFIHVNNKP